MMSFKALGWLLTYPDANLAGAAPEAMRVMEAERLLSPQRLAELSAFVTRLGNTDLIELQEEYTATFDRGRATSLHLFEHVHGESKDRGQAMVDLIGLYRTRGLEMPADELPDFLPLFLEYLSVLPVDEAQAGLADVGPILGKLHAALTRRESRHQAIVAALLDLAGHIAPIAEAPAEEEDIDAIWAEEPVTFGHDAAPGCAKAEDMLQRMNRSPNPLPTFEKA